MSGEEFFSCICLQIPSISSLMSVCANVNSIVPASILERSRISSISCNNKILLLEIIFTNSCFSSSSSVWQTISENPTIAFSGVRISWLILARKADFSRLDSSAFSFASCNILFIFSFSVMFSKRSNPPIISVSFSSPKTGVAVTSKSTSSTLIVCRIILPCSIAFLKAHCPHGSLRSALVW